MPASAVERLADFFGRDEAMHDAYARVESPEVETLHVQNEPILWDGERLAVRRAPLWSEDTEAVLKELLGKSDGEFGGFGGGAGAVLGGLGVGCWWRRDTRGGARV